MSHFFFFSTPSLAVALLATGVVHGAVRSLLVAPRCLTARTPARGERAVVAAVDLAIVAVAADQDLAAAVAAEKPPVSVLVLNRRHEVWTRRAIQEILVAGLSD
jgi:hypothetical protein